MSICHCNCSLAPTLHVGETEESSKARRITVSVVVTESAIRDKKEESAAWIAKFVADRVMEFDFANPWCPNRRVF